VRLPSTSWRAAGAVLAAVALFLLSAPLGADAAARDGARAAERVTERAVERRLGRTAEVTRTRCGRARRRAYSCAWTATRTIRRGAQRCAGRHRVRSKRGRLRASTLRLRCRTRSTRRARTRRTPPPATAAAPARAAMPAAPPRVAAVPAPPAPAAWPAVAPAPRPPAPPAPPAPAGRPPLFGFNDNSVRAGQVDAATSARLAAAAGANVTRLTFDWRYAERTPGAYDFAEYDAIYAASLARGIRPLWIVMFAPRWAWDDGTTCSGDCRFPPADEHLDDWRRLVARIAARYPQSAGIEVWNEPNLGGFWHGGIDPARYARVLSAAGEAVAGSRPELPVVGGSVSNNQVTDQRNLSLRDFLSGVFAAGGGPAMDALSVHTYPWSLALGDGTIWDRTFAQVRALRDAHAPGTPLWVTETGLSTSGTDLRFRFGSDEQATGLVAQYRDLARAPDIDAVILHTLLAQEQADANIESGYAVLRADLTPKPAYCALARERTGDGC
jgi:hypothetical protein